MNLNIRSLAIFTQFSKGNKMADRIKVGWCVTESCASVILNNIYNRLIEHKTHKAHIICKHTQHETFKNQEIFVYKRISMPYE